MRQVSPIEARKGVYIAQTNNKRELEDLIIRLEKTMTREHIKGKLVYTYVLGSPGKGQKVSWQIYLIR